MLKVFTLVKELFIWIKSGCKLSNSALYRLAICYGCEFFESEKKICKKCGCRMQYKTKLKTAKCPIKKW